MCELGKPPFPWEQKQEDSISRSRTARAWSKVEGSGEKHGNSYMYRPSVSTLCLLLHLLTKKFDIHAHHFIYF